LLALKKLLKSIGRLIVDEKEYDDLIDLIATISEKRNSEISAGEVFLKRGIQKLDKGLFKDSVIYFGKSVMKLAKEESQERMYISLIGLGYAYSHLGLIWASTNCFISAAIISLKEWFESNKITKRAVNCIKQITLNEMLIGRIPIFLSWYEMYSILSRQINDSGSNDDLPDEVLIDGCLGTRLLTTDFQEVSKQTRLPDTLQNCGLWMSRKSLLFLLGQNEILKEENSVDGLLEGDNYDVFFSQWANQPFRNQILPKNPI